MAGLSPTKRKWILVWFIIRFGGIGLLTVSLLTSILNPYLAGALILTIALGSNVALRLLVRESFSSLAPYVIYVGSALGLAGLWFFSIIDVVEALIIFAPIAVGYWILSWYRLWKS